MRRREFIALLGCVTSVSLGCPLAARAQQNFQIGLLVTGSSLMPLINNFVKFLGQFGYVEGKNLVIERRVAEGNPQQLQDFAADLASRKVDVIVTFGTPAGFAAKRATTTIPIVLAANSDPVGVGLVASLDRPGGNLTGTSLMAPELSAKRLEILRTLNPKIARIAILWDSSNPGMAQRVHETQIAADQLQVPLHTVGPRNPDELEAAFAELLNSRPDALLVTTEAFTRQHFVQIIDFVSVNKIASMFEDSSFVEAGGLMSYGPNYSEMSRLAASLADKILRGAKPANLPVEQPTTFELVINVKSAKAIGLDVSPLLLVRADKVIE
jgi:putative tryptophan/tyrosine transport system substrate-binding protein